MSPIQRRFSPASASASRVATRSDGKKTITGYAAVFYRGDDQSTEYGLSESLVERIREGAFTRAINERHDVRGLFNHDPDNLLGRTSSGTLKLSVDRTGLRYEIEVDPADPDHARVLAKIERGDLTGSSFAFRPVKVTWEHNDDGDSVRWIEDVELFDVGPVTYPAYEASTTGLRSSDLQELEEERQRSRDAERCAFVERFLRHWRNIIDAEAEESENDRRVRQWADMKRTLSL